MASSESEATPQETTTEVTGWRVKLYQLNSEGQWDDRGTGEATVWMGAEPFLLVASEQSEKSEHLFMGKIALTGEVYTRQRDTI